MRLGAEMFGLINTNEERPFERKYTHKKFSTLTYRKKSLICS
jgi:hypothetical protein